MSLGLLAVALSIVVSYLATNLHSNLSMQIRYEAIQAAQSVLDKLRFQDIATLGTLTHQDVEIGSRTYSVGIVYCKNPSYCPSNDTRQITVKVSYRAEVVYETDTVFSKFT